MSVRSLWRATKDRLGRKAVADPIDGLRRDVEALQRRLESLPVDAPERGGLLNDLGNRWRDLHARTADPDSIELAIRCYREAITRLRDTEGVTVAIGNLSVGLLDRYNRSGDLADLDEAVTSAEHAVEGAPEGSLEQARHLSNLAHALHERFERTRQPADVEAAISAAERVLALVEVGSREAAAGAMNLAVALLARSGAEDAERAIPLLQTAVATLPDGSPEQTRARAGLAIALLHGPPSVRDSIAADDEAVIDSLLEVVRRSPAHSLTHYAALHAVGKARWAQYQRTADHRHLQAAIDTLQAAVDDAPPDAGELPLFLNDLGIALSELSFISDSAQGLTRALDAWVKGLQVLDERFPAVALDYKLGQQTVSVQLGLAERIVFVYLELADRAVTGRDRMLRNAIWAAEGTKTRLIADLIGGGDLPDPEGAPPELVARERRLWNELRAIDTAALAGHGRGDDMADEERSGRRRQLHGELEETWAALTSSGDSGHEFVALRRRPPLTWDVVADLIAMVGAETAVASMFMTSVRTLLFVLRDGAEAPAVSQIEIGRDGWLDIIDRFDREVRLGAAAATETWDDRLQPLLKAAGAHVRGAQRVVIAPAGWGLQVPWATVARRAGWRAPDGAAMPIVTVESLGLLHRLLVRDRAVDGGPVVVGNPTGDLVHAEAEAVEVAGMLGVDPLIGPAATKADVRSALRSARVAHIAGHARFEPGAPLDSGIVLADGVLTAREIMSEPINLDVLVLSACETGVAASLGGYEFAGLSEAFHVAGVRCLVASRWKVDDPVTARLMSRFYGSWRAGADVAAALRDAMAEAETATASTEGGRRDARAPRAAADAPATYYWDSFAVSGDWIQPWPGS